MNEISFSETLLQVVKSVHTMKCLCTNMFGTLPGAPLFIKRTLSITDSLPNTGFIEQAPAVVGGHVPLNTAFVEPSTSSDRTQGQLVISSFGILQRCHEHILPARKRTSHSIKIIEKHITHFSCTDSIARVVGRQTGKYTMVLLLPPWIVGSRHSVSHPRHWKGHKSFSQTLLFPAAVLEERYGGIETMWEGFQRYPQLPAELLVFFSDFERVVVNVIRTHSRFLESAARN